MNVPKKTTTRNSMMIDNLKNTSSKYLRYTAFALSLAVSPMSAMAAGEVTLTLDNADVRELIRWAQDVTNKTIIIHPNVKGKVTVMAGDPMTQGEAYQIFLSTLQVHGFSVVETSTSIKIIPDALAKQSAIPLFNDSGASAEEMVVQIIKIENVAATQLINILRPLVPQVGHLAAYPSTNSLIIADRASNIHKIMRIINEIDQAGGVEIELIELEYAGAKDVLAVIQKLIPNAQGGKGAASSLGVKIAADERSNSLLLSGDPAMRSQIRQLAKRLDQPLAGNGNTQVYFLNYATATAIAPILESMSGSVQRSDKNQKAEDQEFSIQANEELNAIVVTAPPSLQSTIKGVIANMDIRRAQVLVEALIVEVNEGKGTEIGVEWGAIGNDQQIAGSGGFPGGNPTGLLGKNPTTDPIEAVASGLTLGYLNNAQNITAVVNLLAGDKNANILSTPTIMALDNEEAKIFVGDNVSVVTGSRQGTGDTQPFQTFERKDIGIGLTITPRINNDGSVTLDIEQEVNDISEGATPEDTRFSKREFNTRVLVEDDEVLVLGGLIKDTISQTESKVPLLGDIPLLGYLFKSSKNVTVKNNLMLFIHPKIIRSKETSTELSLSRYKYMRENQKDFRGKVDTFFLEKELPALRPLDSYQQPATEQPASE